MKHSSVWLLVVVAGCTGGDPGRGEGPFGSMCTSDADCSSDLCAIQAEGGFCTAACGSDCDCPAGFGCAETSGGFGACRPGSNACSSGCGDGCGAGEVCDHGSCVALPDRCPCPIESYCDILADRCVAGCTADEHCNPGRICNVDARQCRDGCRDDAACGPGRICDDAAMVCVPGCRADGDCGTGNICVGLACRPGCRADSDCGGGEACVRQTCTRGCRSVADCPSGASCVDAVCECPVGRTACGSECVDVTFDDRNCGACGRACSDAGSVCRSGECVCPPGLTSCDGSCVDLMTDVHHCGRCTTDCGPGTATTCGGGLCDNGPQPDDGMYSVCHYDSDCSWADPTLRCIYFPFVGKGFCAGPCTGPGETSTCDPTPGGSASPTCTVTSTDGSYVCALDCTSGGCPSGMRCDPTSLGRICL